MILFTRLWLTDSGRLKHRVSGPDLLWTGLILCSTVFHF